MVWLQKQSKYNGYLRSVGLASKAKQKTKKPGYFEIIIIIMILFL